MNPGDTDLFGSIDDPNIIPLDEYRNERRIEDLEQQIKEYQERLQLAEDNIQFLRSDIKFYNHMESKIFEIIAKLSVVVSISVIFIIGMIIMDVIAK